MKCIAFLVEVANDIIFDTSKLLLRTIKVGYRMGDYR